MFNFLTENYISVLKGVKVTISLCSQYKNSSTELYLRKRGELTLIAEPLVIRVDDRGVDDGGVAQLMVA